MLRNELVETKEIQGLHALGALGWILEEERILVGKLEILIVFSLANDITTVLISYF